MQITGCVPFKNKVERRKQIYDLKQEYGQNVRIWIENRLIMYKSYIKANY